MNSTTPISATATLLMMKKACVLGIFLLCCFLLPACEELVDPDLPFVERLVVQATLVAGSPADSIFIKRTLPLSDHYDPASAVITDVTGWVESDGNRYPLIHRGESRYEADGLTSQVGKRYTLMAEWHGKKVWSSTTVPPMPSIDSTIVRYEPMGSIDSAAFLVEAVVTPIATATCAMEVYDEPSSFGNTYPLVSLNYHGIIKRPEDTLADGKVHLRFDLYPIEIVPGASMLVVYSYDLPFYEFHRTLGRRNQDPLFGNSQPVRWNVEGDGIGIFIGRNMASRIL